MTDTVSEPGLTFVTVTVCDDDVVPKTVGLKLSLVGETSNVAATPAPLSFTEAD